MNPKHDTCCDCTDGHLGNHCEDHFEAADEGDSFQCDPVRCPDMYCLAYANHPGDHVIDTGSCRCNNDATNPCPDCIEADAEYRYFNPIA